MRAATLIAAIAALALTAACSRHDDHAAKDFRKLAAEAKVEAHKLGDDTRHAAHNVAQPDHADSRS
jgi:hypothetical protein